MSILGDLHWGRSHLVHMVEPRYSPPMVGHMGVDTESFRDLQWGIIHLVKMVGPI